MNDYLWKQLNGVYAQSTLDGCQNSYTATNELTSYLYNLNIDNASEKELENIGRLIGYVRPYVPDEFLSTNSLLFFATTEEPVFSTLHGFSSVDDLLTGGKFTSVNSNLSKLPLDIYRSVLKRIADIKYNGLSIFSLDKLIAIANVDYTFTYNVDHDIVVSVENTINIIYIYIFQQVFELFASQPQIIIEEL